MKALNKIICTSAAATLGLFLGAGVSFAQYNNGTTPPPVTTPNQQTPTTPGTQNTNRGMETPQTRGDQTMDTSQSSTNTMRRMTDAEFAKRATEANLAEVKMGQLAQQNGTNSAVKDLGKRMVDDHTKANDQLKDAAAQSNVTIPTELTKKDQEAYDRLSKLSGKSFDRAYARDMVRDHEHDIAEFKTEARDGKDPSIKSFASQTMPTLEMHLKQARQVLRSVSPSTTTTRTGAQ